MEAEERGPEGPPYAGQKGGARAAPPPPTLEVQEESLACSTRSAAPHGPWSGVRDQGRPARRGAVPRPQPRRHSLPVSAQFPGRQLGEAAARARVPWRSGSPSAWGWSSSGARGAMRVRRPSHRCRPRGTVQGTKSLEHTSQAGGLGQAAAGPAWQICVKTVAGQSLACHALPSQEVTELKGMIQERTGLPLERQRLTFNGHDIEDERNLLDQRVCGGATIWLLSRLRGG